MIDDYTDHAANERTYLAWVRTALAFMGFGLILERFDLFVQAFAGSSLATQAPSMTEAPAAPPAEAGTVLILLGVLVLVISSFRYLRFKQLIASPDPTDYRSSRTDLALVVIVIGLALGTATYVALAN